MDPEQFPKLDEALLRSEPVDYAGDSAQHTELFKILSQQELTDSYERARVVKETFKAIEQYRETGIKRIQAILDPTAPQYRPEELADAIEGIDIFREVPEGIDEEVLERDIDRGLLEKQEFWKTLSFEAQRDILHDIQHVDGRLDLYYPGAASHLLPRMQDYGNYYIRVNDSCQSRAELYDTRDRSITIARKMTDEEVKARLATTKEKFNSPDFVGDNFDRFYHAISSYAKNLHTTSNAPAIGTRSALHPNE